jgi:hypothetical protein
MHVHTKLGSAAPIDQLPGRIALRFAFFRFGLMLLTNLVLSSGKLSHRFL